MNYWFAEMTNMNDLTIPVFDYLEVRIDWMASNIGSRDSSPRQKTWAPRGAYTAGVLYNTSEGWVTHNEVCMRGEWISQVIDRTHTGLDSEGIYRVSLELVD